MAGGRLEDEVAKAVGLPDLAVHRSPSRTRSSVVLRKRLEGRLQELEAEPTPPNDTFTRNTATLARILGLTPMERDIVTLAMAMQSSEGLATLFQDPGPGGFAEICGMASSALGAREAEVRAALRPDGALRGTGLVALHLAVQYVVAFSPMPGLAEAMLSGRRSARSIMRMFVREAPATKLDVESFAHAGDDVRAILRLLRGAFRRRARGVNILLHGAPGVGKTELTRVVAQSLGARLFEVPDEDDEGDAMLGKERLSDCALAQRTLAWAPRTLLVFDEVEDAFRARWEGSLGLIRESGGTKSWTNRLMEATPLPTFWLANQIGQIDPAMLRRFDLVVELRTPPAGVRKRMLADALGDAKIDDALLDRLASDQRLTPAHVARAVRVTRLMNARSPADVTDSLSHILSRNLAAHGPARAKSTVQLVCGPYDLDLVHAATDLRPVTEAVVRQRHATICLYGPPGTGKTAWAHHLAHRLDVPMRAARASDLLGCYVGETEKNIAALFATARDEGALLFLDEADSFLQDRVNAVRSWEITQVNELLVQMEAFEGVFLCATNLVDSLDRAALRRFSMKIEFKPLRSAARWMMLLRLVPAADSDVRVRVALDRLDGLTPGDFAAVARQAKLAGAEGDAYAIVAMLEREVMLRRRGTGRSIGFDAAVGAQS